MAKTKHKRNAKHTKINAEEEDRKTMLTDGTKTMQRREEKKEEAQLMEEAHKRNEAREK